MADNPRRRGRLIAADAFLPYFPETETVERLQPLLGTRRDWPAISADFEQVGFQRAFEALHADGQPYSHFLTIRRCYVSGLPGESSGETEELARASSPIGFLFVDSVKYWYSIRQLALAVIDCLEPGAIVAWQDQRWFTCFGISYLNERLGDAMRLLAIADGMHVYRYRGGVDADTIARIMPETVAEIPAAEFRSTFHEIAWRNYICNDASGVLSATLQLGFALASQGQQEEAQRLFESARSIPGFGDHDDLFQLAHVALKTIPSGP